MCLLTRTFLTCLVHSKTRTRTQIVRNSRSSDTVQREGVSGARECTIKMQLAAVIKPTDYKCACYAWCSLHCYLERKQRLLTHLENNVFFPFFFLLFVTLRWLLKPERRALGHRYSAIRFILYVTHIQYIHPIVRDAINPSRRWTGPVWSGIPPL